MSSSDTAPGPRKKPKSAEEMSDQIDELRSEIQNLASTVTDVAGKQLSAAQNSLETSIRNNPFAAVGIAAGIGFLYVMIRR
jgi:ElaB/YqjD/DUF883 family membrane-anchored ribosome-binding protein